MTFDFPVEKSCDDLGPAQVLHVWEPDSRLAEVLERSEQSHALPRQAAEAGRLRRKM